MVKSCFILMFIAGVIPTLSGVSSCWFCNNTSDAIIFKNLYDEKLQKLNIPENLAAGKKTKLTNVELVIFTLAENKNEYTERLAKQAYYIKIRKANDGVVTITQSDKNNIKLQGSMYPSSRLAKAKQIKKVARQGYVKPLNHSNN